MQELYIQVSGTKIVAVSIVESANYYKFKTDLTFYSLVSNLNKYKLSDDYTISGGEILGTLELIPTSVSLSQDSVDIAVGGVTEIIAYVKGAQDRTLVFKSMNTSVATISYDKNFDSYEIVGVSSGKTTIRFVSKENRSAFKDLTVNVQ